MRTPVIVAMLLSVATLNSCSDPSASPSAAGQLVPPSAALNKADLDYYWQVPLKLETGDTVAALCLLDENLYVLTQQNYLFVIDAATARPDKWPAAIRIDKPGQQVFFPPCHADRVALSEKAFGISEMTGATQPNANKVFNAVIVNSLNHALVIDRDNGTIVRDISFRYPAATDGATDGSHFYVGSGKGRLRAYRLQEGLEVWSASIGDSLTAPIQCYGGKIFVGGDDSKFYCYQNTGPSGKVMWSAPTTGPITAQFVVDARGCFVPCTDSRLYAFDAVVGKPLWGPDPFICKGQLLSPVQVGEKTVFQYADGDRLYAIDLANGKPRWTRADGRTVAAVIDNNVYMVDGGGRLRVLDEIMGTEKSGARLGGLSIFAANVKSPAIYAANAGGRIVCIRPISAGYLTPAKAAAQNRVPTVIKTPTTAPAK